MNNKTTKERQYILEEGFAHEEKDSNNIHSIYMKVLKDNKTEDITDLYLALRDKYVYIPMNLDFKLKHPDPCISSVYALDNSFLEDAYIIPDEQDKNMVGCFLTKTKALNDGPQEEVFLCYTSFHNLLFDFMRTNEKKQFLDSILIDPFQDDYAIYFKDDNLQLFYGLECAIYNAPKKYLKKRID